MDKTIDIKIEDSKVGWISFEEVKAFNQFKEDLEICHWNNWSIEEYLKWKHDK